MKYPSNGGNFANFNNVGDRYDGTYLCERAVPSQYGGDDRCIEVTLANGGTVLVRLNLAAIGRQWAYAKTKQAPRVGERLSFEFMSKYDSKKFGPGRGKNVEIDFLDRVVGEAAVAVETTGTLVAGAGAALEAAYDVAVSMKGEATAKQIRAAVESVEKDPAAQARMLLKAVGA